MSALRMWWIVPVGIVLFLSFLPNLAPAASTNVDASWGQVYGRVLTDGLRLGQDVVFTYGPFGYFYKPAYAAELYVAASLWQAMHALVLSVLVLLVARRTGSALAGASCIAVAALLVGGAVDAAFYFAICGATVLAATADPWRMRNAIAAATLLGIAALMKFSFFLLALPCVLVLCGQGARAQGRRAAAALAPAAWFAATLAAAWMLAGQRIGDLLPWIGRSLSVVAGYSAAMSIEGPAAEVLLGLLATLLALIAILVAVPAPARPGTRLAALLLALALFLAFKAGFVRHDIHAMTAFGFAPAAAFLLPPPRDASRASRRRRALWLVLTLATCAAAFSGAVSVRGRLGQTPWRATAGGWLERIERRAHRTMNPVFWRDGFEHEREQLRRVHDLPRTRAAIGDRTADILDWEQGVLFLNGVRWSPRPVFHGNLCYTPALMAMNAERYCGDRAPDFVIVKVQAFARWLWPMVDAGPMQIVLRDYRFVHVERDYVLFERAPRTTKPQAPLPAEREPSRTGTFRFGDEIVLARDGGAAPRSVHVRLDLRETAFGKLRGFVYKPPEVHVTARLSDGTAVVRRVIPAMMRTPVLVSPWVESTAELVRLAGGTADRDDAPLRTVESLALRAAGAGYAEDFGCALWFDALPPPRP